MKRRMLILFAGVLASLRVAAQNSGGSGAGSGRVPQYGGGGGLRGATADLPEGWLVSSDEALQFKGAEGFDDPLPLRTRAVVPSIEILQPQTAGDQKVKAPFPIAVKFVARDDAAIVPSTFKVLYGGLRLDITGRITKFAKPTTEGISFDKAQIPPGKHRLVLVVEDEKQRVAERELRIEVE